MKNAKRIISPALLVIAAMIWGFAFSAQKDADSIPPLTLGAARSLCAAIFLIPVIIVFDKALKTERRLFSKEKGIDINRTEIIGGIICGAVLALASFFQQLGINGGTDAGKSAFITALYVVLVPIYALALKKKAPLNVWISICIALVGFYLLCITESFTIVFSDAFVLVCAMLFPIHILIIDRFSPLCDGIRMSFIQFVSAFIINLALALIFEPPISFSLLGECILPIIYLGVGSSGIAYTLQIVGQRGINPAVASVLLSLESVFGVVGSMLFLGERMSGREYFGCAAVFVAVIISQFDFKKLLKKEKA